jgi:ectoine hydroxylase-related dioxygenase (phytanoyl-CoA dioxygenase family)
VWIALDDATEENGCLKIIPSSHKKLYTHDDLQEETNILFHRLVEDELEGESVVTTELRSGGALFFHDQLVHSSHPNRSGADRFCFIPTYRSADEPDSSTIWSASLPLGGDCS